MLRIPLGRRARCIAVCVVVLCAEYEGAARAPFGFLVARKMKAVIDI